MALEKKRISAELLRVQASRAEMEYLIEQRLEEIERLKQNINKQLEAEGRLQAELDKLGGK